MNEEANQEQAAEQPVVAVFADGRVVIGTGVTLGQVLQALDAARGAVLGIRLGKE